MTTADRLREIMQAERDGLKAEERISHCPPYVAVADMEIAAHSPMNLRRQAPVTCSRLEGRGDQAFAMDCPALHYKALWVLAADSNYRKYYREFLGQEHKLQLEALPKEFDVDHLFNRQRAIKYGYRYCRMALVGYSANRSHGASYEKIATQGTRQRGDCTRVLMDEITHMKYYGFMSPSEANPRPEEIEAYARFAAVEFGQDPSETRESIATLLKVVKFFKAGKG